MREIKFRAWSDINNEMLDWEVIKKWQLEVFDFSKIMMQFTGLKDKNGKECYEGDILSKPHSEIAQFELNPKDESRWVVEWIGKGFADNKINQEKIPYEKTEIIGNIYENKELLEVKKKKK